MLHVRPNTFTNFNARIKDTLIGPRLLLVMWRRREVKEAKGEKRKERRGDKAKGGEGPKR